MKRLKYYLLQMENQTITYKEMYTGKMVVFPSTNQPAWVEYSNEYYYNDCSFSITNTHKLAQDKPTLTWNIPIDKIGLKNVSATSADYCLRSFAQYIDFLNEELYNRSRPDNENGKYYLYHPGGEVLTRNTAYYALCPRKDYD